MGYPNHIAGILIPLATATILIGACSTGPGRPLMSAWDEDAGFGYSERKIETARYEVTYVGPFLRTHSNPELRVDDVKKFRKLAEDLALWRATDIAKAGKYSALQVGRTNSDIVVESYNYDPHIVRYGLSDSDGKYRYVQSQVPAFKSAWLQSKAVIVVILKRSLGKNDKDVETVAKSMAKRHYGARRLPAY